MWNPFSYISYGTSPTAPSLTPLLSPTPQQQLQQQHHISQQNSLTKQKYLIEQFVHYHKRVKQFQVLIRQRAHDQEETERLVRVFKQLIMALEGFEGELGRLKQEYEGSLGKVENYESIQRKLEKHDSIVESILESHEREIDSVTETFRRREIEMETNLKVLNNQLEQKTKEIMEFQTQIIELKDRNQILERQNQELGGRYEKFVEKCAGLQAKLGLLMGRNGYDNKQTIRRCEAMRLSPATGKTLPQLSPQLLFPQHQPITLPTLLLTPHLPFSPLTLPFLTLPDLLALSLTNRPFNTLITLSLAPLLHRLHLHQHQKQLQTLKKESIYFNHVLLDQVDGENVKISAIKYLFFKHKPGTYILGMLQEDVKGVGEEELVYVGAEGLEEEEEEHREIGEGSVDSPVSQASSIAISNTNNTNQNPKQKQSKLSTWKNYFRSDKSEKSPNQPQQLTITSKISNLILSNPNTPISQNPKTTATSPHPQRFSLAQLKNSQTFKTIAHHLSKSFHQHVFSLKLPKDLQSFGKLMTQQFAQLKHELTAMNTTSNRPPTIRQWTSKLLTLSKFLYLESQQLWTLGQNVFAKLMQFQRENTKLKSEIEDLTESRQGLRRLVDQLAKSKLQMEKRIWEAERKNGFLKLSTENIQRVNEKLENDIQALRTVVETEQGKNYELQKELKHSKEKLSSLHRKYREKMEEFNELKQEIAKISWI